MLKIHKEIKLNDRNLLAPCGLYCGECQALQDGRCGGCISRQGLCLKYSKICKIFDCCINENKFRFCYECSKFPCRNFNFFKDEKYDGFSEVVNNLKEINKIGVENYLEKEVKRVQELIKCAKQKGIKHCSECKDWPCKKLERPPLRPA